MAEDSPASRPSILCVDDNPGSLRIRKDLLEVLGFSVELATSGQTALDLLKRHPFNAVITDFRMSGMDGAELVDRIRALHPKLPIILLTGYPDEIPQRTQQSVDKVFIKGHAFDEYLDALFRLTGTERRHQRPGSGVSSPVNVDGHIESVRRFLHRNGRKP